MPEAFAMERVLQCVAPLGVDSRVLVRTCSTSASETLRGAPGRGSSVSPSRRCSRKRERHLPTVTRVAWRCSATAEFDHPSAASRTIRARLARPWAVLRRRAHPWSTSRSSSVTSSSLSLRPCGMATSFIIEDARTRNMFIYLWRRTLADTITRRRLRRIARGAICSVTISGLRKNCVGRRTPPSDRTTHRRRQLRGPRAPPPSAGRSPGFAHRGALADPPGHRCRRISALPTGPQTFRAECELLPSRLSRMKILPKSRSAWY